MVAAGKAKATDVQLTWHSERDRLHTPVEDDHSRSANWSTNGDRIVRSQGFADSRDDRCFCGPVNIVEDVAFRPFCEQLARECFTADSELT
ncbi:hypothetical protein GCM10011410_13360 [Hoyosella rhizosphaerae]|uniref:Uncharacterized protein n=1 Tax=Hoyosella rhizosphaerae TaxID=1755582 RepID=A0A916XBR6_9ACTN|nr:hypothetical protein GCM10011410_13360 [Hoyosella rhizosphaerae]